MTARVLDPRTPVLVGAGRCHDSVEAAELMAMATASALTDSGGKGLAGAVDRIAVPQGSWTNSDPGRLVAHRIGATTARTHLVELGIPQQSLINEAMAAILTGASDVAVIVGGESRRWARGRQRDGFDAEGSGQDQGEPDVVRRRQGPLLEPIEVEHRLWDPVQQYAMIENALRFELGRSVGEHRAAVAGLWARWNEVAATNPWAAFPAALSAAELDQASPGNRPLAFPYNKWHATQWTVDQAAAVVLCSVEAAQRHGIPTDRWIFPLVGLESSSAVSLVCRDSIPAWPAMEILGESASRRLGKPLHEIDVIELYSCFPAAVEIQQRSLGLDPSGTYTTTGGMAFAGGPFNNAVLQNLVATVDPLRAEPDALGLLTTVSGLLTKPGLGVWGARPDGQPPLLADLGYEATAVTPTIPAVGTLDGYRGRAVVATYTVTYEGMDPARTIAICDTTDGRRCVAFNDDASLAAQCCAEELIGASVEVSAGSFAVG